MVPPIQDIALLLLLLTLIAAFTLMMKIFVMGARKAFYNRNAVIRHKLGSFWIFRGSSLGCSLFQSNMEFLNNRLHIKRCLVASSLLTLLLCITSR